jgi:uncharacterized protein YciI
LLFALVAHDKPGQLWKRQETRPEHLKFLETLGDRLILAGPFLDDKGDMTGSIVVIEAESYEAAKADFDRDPYGLAGLFDSVLLKRWHLGINNTKK